MEERTTVGCIWYAMSILHDHLIGDINKALLLKNSSFFIVVFKTAVVFVCKDGSKQKKKMVGFLKN